ncbi:MAG: PVC-type heme-binding CxxCH protein [Pirellulaceae bacterium]
MTRRWITFVLLVLLACGQRTVSAQDRPLPPAEAAGTMKLPAGFTTTLFAGEPDVVQPIAFTFDDRGRLWVIECLSYPTWKEDGTGSDRVTILEDTNGDGRHDKRTVFFDQGTNLSGIEVGFGGVWLTAVPNLIFIPDANGDDQPDGPAKVLLDGWDLKAKHNVVGNLAWGPDGWLYGLNGILSNSKVGKPGTPDVQRVEMNCGVWRYHPVRHTFEAYAHGTTNPWGIDWDQRGQMFITNCVIKHLFHVVPGGHYVRMSGQDINPHSYGLIESCADHQHWAGGHWTESRGGEGAHGDAGGGHAHSGSMIYLGDNWPAEYRGNAFTLNIHGRRLNRDLLERHGSGYVARHASDFAFSQDPWFRGLHAKYGPDGGVFISDWSDTGECHDYNEDDCDRTGGRIFKIVYSPDSEPEEDSPLGVRVEGRLVDLSNKQLVGVHGHRNEWWVRHARRLLQERAAADKLDAATVELLLAQVTHMINPDDSLKLQIWTAQRRLRAAQTLIACGLLDDAALVTLVGHDDPDIAGLAMLAAVDGRRPSAPMLDQMASLAGEGESSGSALRLSIASALQRLPLKDRWPIAKALLAHAEDADDRNLPLMIWYAVEPLVPADPRQAIGLLGEAQIPLVRQYLARRIVAVHEGDGQPKASNAWVLDELFRALVAGDDAVRLDILAGLAQAYRGRRTAPAPAGWSEYFPALKSSDDAQVQDRAVALAVLFGDQKEMARLEDLVMKRTRATLSERQRALELLVTKLEPEFGKSVLMLLREPELRPDAIRALAAFDLPEIPPRLVTMYPNLSPVERQDAIQTLTARPAFALALLAAIEQEIVPRHEVSALVVRQLQALDNQQVSERLASVWGDIRPASADKQRRIGELKERLTPEHLQLADLSRGRELFARTCATCHKLFDEGSRVGPELTGSQRTNLDYVLDNVLDPSGIVPRDYQANILRLADGRVVQGVILEETPQTLAVQTANEIVRIPTGEIQARKVSPLSMMPEGLLDRLSPDQVRDLVSYLASPRQVPLPILE